MLTYSNTGIYFASAAKAMHIENNYADYASSIKKAPGEIKNTNNPNPNMAANCSQR